MTPTPPLSTGMTISLRDPMVILAGIKQFGLAGDGSDLRDLETAIEALAASPTANVPPQVNEAVGFQYRVAPWMQVCFGPEISNDRLERGDRALEEMLEMLQSGDYPRERVGALTEYVYSRSKGEPHQEVGGVMVTLAAYCLAHGLDMHRAAEDELARIWTKVEKIRAKQATKPVGSALPVASPSPGTATAGASDPDFWHNGMNQIVSHAEREAWRGTSDEDMIGRYTDPLYASPSDQSRVERLETALRPFAELANKPNYAWLSLSGLTVDDLERARKALGDRS